MGEQQGELLAPRKLKREERKQREALIEKGNAAFDAEDYDVALECYHHASRLDGSEALIWSLLGLTYANLDFNREAWRSYKLALTCDGEHLDSLWYASEFLAGVEDWELAHNMLLRYLALEHDEDKRAEANELMSVVRLHLPNAPAAPREVEEGLENLASEGEFDDELAGYDLDEDDDEDDFDSSFDEDEEGYDDDEDYEMVETVHEQFVASVVLQLNGMGRKCQECSTPLPADAPYCYNCSAPQFYGRN